ncbi:MAG TPA: ornithine carbamoyltransferase [Candidatus Thermoplasmatota archaeon]|nr:ornithine carbamoyltransferase [Candidatus Thermoplasmatota archaeon]
MANLAPKTRTAAASRTTDFTERMEFSSVKSAQSVVSSVPGARSVLGMQDVAPYLGELLEDAMALKAQGRKGPLPQSLAGKAILMIYEKNSTRTRVSFEVGVQRLGGIAINLDSQTSQLSRGESMEDTAQVLSRYGHALVYRANRHDSLEALARYATVPVVNALTDKEHPCQILADWMTLVEHFNAQAASEGPKDRALRAEHYGGVAALKGKVFCYVGDGNNMLHSYLLGAAMAGMHVQAACPKGYGPDPEILEQAKAIAARSGTRIVVFRRPEEALDGADVVATDTWVSMGDEAEMVQRQKAFAGYTLTEELLAAHAAPGAVFLHCLPGHWGEEATYELAHGPRSLIYDEAENRMWAQMALLVRLVGDRQA